MYGYLFFSISLVSIFSIIENIKGGQRLSIFKVHILAVLVCIFAGSFFFFLDELGYNVNNAINISRLISAIFLVNIFFILSHSQIPKKVIILEGLFVLFYIFLFFKGFVFLNVKDGIYNIRPGGLHLINFFITFFFVFFSVFYNVRKLRNSVNKNNLYQFKLLKWSSFLLVFFVSIVLGSLYNIWATIFPHFGFHADTRVMNIVIYLILILFFLLRPKFIDELDFSLTHSFLSSSKSPILLKDFEFLFYSNFYYLRSDANLDDFSLKLNHEKTDVIEFIDNHIGDSFIYLVNRNRIKYFRSLLDDRKFESFTIEALSEMSGFNNRQSMYNAFKKFVGCTPSVYISNLK